MIPLSASQIKQFQEEILSWYEKHQRDLPWRKTRNPYHILVSEIMLQQTQVNRVIPKYQAWFEAFPTVKDLAKAATPEVLRLWSGLGYNRRALNLKKTAVIVSETYNGTFPKTEKELLALPGIGVYTARAILCFAFNEQVTVVDTNVRKVILTQVLVPEPSENSVSRHIRLSDSQTSRISGLPSFQSFPEKEINQIAEQILPPGKAYEWNQALMDYASAVLKKEKLPIPKQSKFHGSHRYYRGQILKVLLEKKSVQISDLGSLIKNDYSEEDKAWLMGIVDELIHEGFIVKEKKSVCLSH